MNALKSLQHRIRGWFPKDPSIPTIISPPHSFPNTANPSPPSRQFYYAVPDYKIIQNTWYLKGAGYVGIMVGLFGALESYFFYEQERVLLRFGDIPADNPLFTALPVWIATFAILGFSGAIAALIGFLIDKKQSAREFFFGVKPHRCFGNYMFKGGLAFSMSSLLWFFNYLVNPYWLGLWTTAIFASVGIGSLVIGILTLRKKRV
ncbi:MAG: hypothetical protein NWE92_00210 [Candidatus Bathyarchaeota archaeon]|nr:hypothetical protein [Candidatus Bathyarchaeota archaeon]